ncbi:hypothetical protein [Falsiroseomonas oryzae]|uniref:hypothetical protein n=1 Tax=Falsiroseomonas oryzae TaxID=2766473 RepID=UPI0022EBA353|nr:hypothetical protein [Roseomonas sp. MO-31]
MSGDGMGEAAGGPGRGGHERLHRAKEVVAEELRRYAITVVYIFVLLSMFTLHEEIALRTHDGISQAIPFAPHGFAVINALVLGKVALVVEQLRLGQRLKPEPLIWPILLESLILAILFIAMHMAEHIIGGWLHGEALAKSVPAVGGGGVWGVVFATIAFFVAMIPFCGFRQITLSIGWPRMRAILFGVPEDAWRR